MAVYNATKFGVTAASESWRQEFSRQDVRVSVVEPGVVDTELFGHQQPAVQEHYDRLFAGVERLRPSDVADVISFIVTAPAAWPSPRSSSAPPTRPEESACGQCPTAPAETLRSSPVVPEASSERR